MSSITYWHRLEPRPRAPSLNDALTARVRDPLWFLTRQWQFGEFQGEDAGSPAFATVSSTNVPIGGWRAGGSDASPNPLPPTFPLEALVEREAFTPNLTLAVELAQMFEALVSTAVGLSAQQRLDVVAALRAGLPLTEPAADDQDARRVFLVAAGRSFDGVAWYEASRTNPPTVPTSVTLPPAVISPVRTIQSSFANAVAATYGDIGRTDPDAWQPSRLEYAASLIAESPDGDGALDLAAGSSLDGAFEWHAFSLGTEPPTTDGLNLPAARQATSSIIPSPVRFRGMPNARWWDFESGTIDFGDIRPDRRDLARLVAMDFMLVHGNDWFVIPHDVPVGSLERVDTLMVRDVFGGDTPVTRADARVEDPGQRWSLFSIASAASESGFADFFLLPPTAAEFMQMSQPIEDVRFLRDELANMAWAVEEVAEGGAGRPRPGHERSVALQAPPPTSSAPLSYLIQTSVPAHWIPFVPVTIDAVEGSIVLERAGMPNAAGTGLIEPAGRLLTPSRLAGEPYQIFEEEVPRAGTRVTRVVCRARWIDGSTHVWIARRRDAGLGEASSGLLFDSVVAQA